MGRYYYPDAHDALTAKKQFLREHHYYAKHCFQNTWGTGYVIFDTKEEVNKWHKEHAGTYFYDEEYEAGTTFTEADAIKEIEDKIEKATEIKVYYPGPYETKWAIMEYWGQKGKPLKVASYYISKVCKNLFYTVCLS